VAALASAALVVTSLFATAAPAAAAGTAVLDVDIAPVDYATGQPQTTASYNEHGNRVAYRVSYSCAVEVCTDTTVTITPPQPNPYGIAPTMTYLGSWGPNLLTYDTWTAPAGLPGAAISGDDVTGKVISLGDVPAGTSGSFVVVYAFPTTVNRAIIPAQLYPDGFEIVHAATISSPNATADVTAPAAPVTWHITVPSPAIVMTNPGTVRPDVNVTYQIRMSSGSMGRSGGNIYGSSNVQAAGNHTVTVQLPPEAEYVSSVGSPAAVYDETAHTLTWTEGSEVAPTACAGGGWGSTTQTNGYWNTVAPCYTPRSVTLRYPATAFTSDPSGCNFDANVAPQVRVDVTYLDTARTAKSATATATHSVSCYDPFGRINLSKESTNDGGTYPPNPRPVNVPPVVDGMVCDSSGFDDWGRACTTGQPLAPFGSNNKYWYVYAYNAGNVPGVATVVDDDLDQPGMPVYQIQTSAGTPTPTIEYTYQCGTDEPVSESIQATSISISTLVGAATDCRFTAATVTSGTMPAGNVRPADTGVGSRFDVIFRYSVAPGAPTGTRDNQAVATMTYPDYPELADEDFTTSVTRSVNLRPWPTTTVLPGISAGFASAPAVDGGGQAVPGRAVTFSVNGQTTRFSGDSDFAPQYFFVAPVGWTITSGSAAFAGSVPAGVHFDYRTVEIDGAERDVVVASWPAGVTFGENVTLPTMTVVASPTFAVAAGTTSVAEAWIGDSRNAWDATTATFGGARQDDADADADGSVDDWVSVATQNILVSSADAVTVVKEICLPDPTADDECEWIGDSSHPVPVGINADDIRYRVTIQNTGNTTLSGIVAYDVLPYVGDHGTSDGTASTPRGSTFNENLASVDEVDSDLDLTFSASTNPPRLEVYSGATTGSWGDTVTGMQAIRASYAGSLAPGESVGFSYTASVGAEATADSIACNSIAIDTASTLPSEPPAVCAITAEADVEISVPERLPLQVGRPGVIPFTILNHGGSLNAPVTVTVDVPAGVTVSSLAPEGWSCTLPDGATVPAAGPLSVTCEPVTEDGGFRPMVRDIPDELDLPVVPTAVDDDLCVPATVTGQMVDPNLVNNDTSTCMLVAALSGGELAVSKDDGLTTVAPGQQYDYEITVENLLVGEGVTGVVVTDALPAGLRFVAASDGGAVSGQNPDGTGGTVTWPAVDLAAAGVIGDGTDTSGGAGASITRTVTVQVDSAALGTVVNTASASAPDPADPEQTLGDSATDTDGLQRLAVTKSTDARAAGVRAGETVTYTVVLTNNGTTAYTAADPARLVDDLSGVLDDAAFDAGSAEISIDGGAAQAVADPVDGRLSWSGALPAGAVATLTYTVTAGDGSSGDRLMTNTAFASDEVAECEDGLAEGGVSCATTTTRFAPEFSKRVVSLAQNDDGTWTIVYALDVVSLDPDAAAEYDLSDDLAFGSGITVLSAAVTDAPDGVALAPWSGSGAIATGATLPANGEHSYQVTVVADAGTVAGLPAAACQAGIAGGFANTGTLSLVDRDLEAETCASPVAPSVAKTVGTPVQGSDGSWTVTYTVTVTNPSTAPAGGLAYTLDDALDLPAGVTVTGVEAAGPGPVNAGFDGTTDTALLTAPDRIPAAPSASAPATRVYTVTVHATVPAGQVAPADLVCAPAGSGGYANAVTLLAGDSDDVLDTADACAPITPAPTPEIVKQVTGVSIDATSGEWTIQYAITVTNPDPAVSTVYDLDDDLQFAAGAEVVSSSVSSTDATVRPAWDGVADTSVATGQLLPGGGVDVYSVSVTVDATAVDPESAAADCLLDPGETGTGYRNLATVTSGGTSAFSVACEPATDPSVVKTVSSAPAQDPATGLWTVRYDITVTNRSVDTVGTIPYSLEDSFGLPDDVEIVDVSASTSGDGTINPGFDGVSDTALATGEIGAATSEAEPATHVYTVTVTTRVPAGPIDGATCDPAQGAGGFRNQVGITVGGRETGDVACADLPAIPTPGLGKQVLSQAQQADGSWLLLYRLTVQNLSATAAASYDLSDELGLGDGISVVGTPTIVAAPAGVALNGGWDGSDDTAITEDVLLPAGGTHAYTVRVVADAGTVRGTDPAGDCELGTGETGTGFLNFATLDTGIDLASASACATAHDPGVTKTIDGEPVQQADGSWLLSYHIQVDNPSDVALSYGLSDVLDLPAGTVVTVVSASGRAGAPAVRADWDGATQPVLVDAGASLPARASHVFDVVIDATLPAGQGSEVDGWHNTAIVASSTGGAVTTPSEVFADIEVPELSIEKTVDAPAVPRIGDTVDYTVTVRNTGLGDFTALYPAVVWDDLAGVLDDATLDAPATVTPTTGTIEQVDDRLRWTGALAADGTVTIEYTVTVAGGGDADLRNVAFAGSPDPSPVTPGDADCAEPGCAITDTALPAVFLAKRASADRIAPGDVVTYVVEIANTGGVDLVGADAATVSDDLSGVLDDAALQGDATADVGTATITGTTLTWTGDLPAGATAHITYTVRANAVVTGDGWLDNVATVDPTLPTLGLDGETGTPHEVLTRTAVVLIAVTGVTPWIAAGIALDALLVGFVLVLWRRRRRSA